MEKQIREHIQMSFSYNHIGLFLKKRQGKEKLFKDSSAVALLGCFSPGLCPVGLGFPLDGISGPLSNANPQQWSRAAL